MTYQDQLDEHAGDVSTQVLAALAAYMAGTITLDAFVSVIVAFIQAGSLQAAALADLSLAAVLTTSTGTAVAPLGVGPGDHALDADRLRKATKTILDDLNKPTTEDFDAELTKAQKRFLRLAEAEIKEAAARAYSAAVAESTVVTGWTRGIDADACELCQWWSRGGKVWPADHKMPTHTGCTCNPVPVVKENAA
jgi:hypothetical protein